MSAGRALKRIWQGQTPNASVDAALRLASALYGTGRALHRALYRGGLKRKQRLPALVVSVGNLVAGGVGKTPFCAWLAEALLSRGLRVMVLARGYGRARGAKWNDEGEWLARRLPAVRVVQAPDRARAAASALAAAPVDVVLLDDGFQHEPLARDLDVVLVDARVPFANGHLLPRGPLRERPAALARAQWIVATRCERIDATTLARTRAAVAAVAPSSRFVAAAFPIVALRDGEQRRAPEWLAGQRVVLCAGVGDPDSVRRTLADLGAELVGERIHADHHRYSYRDLEEARRAAAAARARWVVTAKDAVKLDRLAEMQARAAPTNDRQASYVVLEQGVTVDGAGDLLVSEIEQKARAFQAAAGALSRSSSP
ncbi:MAG: tetraacyldisaccharide 4'-kinase [Planctomycetes bacterium]|nr:tetraacyldisaccharide 4'-kinase [Planctomycetota bacterium]